MGMLSKSAWEALSIRRRKSTISLGYILQTAHGGQRKAIQPGDKPEVSFALQDDELIAVYAYCNLHGLWKTEIKK